MKRTQSDGVYIWFWGRSDPRVPHSVLSGGDNVTPDASWGEPDARFPSTSSCNFSKYFRAHQIVFDTTFCVSNVSYTFFYSYNFLSNGRNHSYRVIGLVMSFLQPVGVIVFLVSGFTPSSHTD